MYRTVLAASPCVKIAAAGSDFATRRDGRRVQEDFRAERTRAFRRRSHSEHIMGPIGRRGRAERRLRERNASDTPASAADGSLVIR